MIAEVEQVFPRFLSREELKTPGPPVFTFIQCEQCRGMFRSAAGSTICGACRRLPAVTVIKAGSWTDSK